MGNAAEWGTHCRGETEGFEVFLTTDKNLQYQQNLAGRRLAIVVLSTTSWPRIRAVTAKVLEAVDSAQPGSFIEVGVEIVALRCRSPLRG